jgi:DNA-directed RNA polymerase sigma subunit (sigma70/sigma32)
MAESRPDSFVNPAPVWLEDIPKDVLAMYRVYAEGATLAEVAEQFQRDPKRVRALFDECGLEVRRGPSRQRLPLPPSQPLPPRKPRRPDPIEELRKHQAALETAKVARKEVRKAKTREAAHRRASAMYVRYLEGKTQREVGEEFGVSEARVGQLFKQAGFAARGPARETTDDAREATVRGGVQVWRAEPPPKVSDGGTPAQGTERDADS